MTTRAHRKILFPMITLSALGLLGLTLLALYSKLLFSAPQDALAYQELLIATDPKQEANRKQTYTATQQHQSTRKDFFFLKEGTKLHLQVISSDSELILSHQDENTEMIEKMIDVQWLMQEELFYILKDGREVVITEENKIVTRKEKKELIPQPSNQEIAAATPMQMVRYLKADEALYYYQQTKFKAQQAHVFTYIAPGHELATISINTLTPILSGEAALIEFKLDAEKPEFLALKFKANIALPTQKNKKS